MKCDDCTHKVEVPSGDSLSPTSVIDICDKKNLPVNVIKSDNCEDYEKSYSKVLSIITSAIVAIFMIVLLSSFILR